ncbi:hypothetical protein V5F79_22880 [Xanthobacter flavus]|uniref:hypothetical protein n=1 Tax=Xanthobacter flavus TaxID=281 RepID=UPI003727315D
MTLLVNRDVDGPRTHAFVLGVGSYPAAKAGVGVLQSLQKVPDLPSAADSAKLVTDWLIENQDRLAAPLATLEVLISDPAQPNNRYPWQRGPIDAATAANVGTKGFAWYKRATATQGDVALFYCCGHGASHDQDPVLFLEDLNSDERNAWTHINLASLAQAFRKSKTVSAVFLYSDACGELIPEFELVNDPQSCAFYPQLTPFGQSRNQVSLLCAAAEGLLAYDGPRAAGAQVKFGRFTQTLVQALNGSSARWVRDKWGVCGRDLLGDLKYLRRIFFSHWDSKQPFEPFEAFTQTDRLPVIFPGAFELPIVVMTDPPERMPQYGIGISQTKDEDAPWLKNRDAGDASEWSTTVPPSRDALYAIAFSDQGRYSLLFQPKEPLFDQWVSVP